MNTTLAPIIRPGLSRYVVIATCVGAAIATLLVAGFSAEALSLAAVFAGAAIFFSMRINARSVFHSDDEIVVHNDGEVLRVAKVGTVVEVREVEQYGFRTHRQYVNFVDESSRPRFDNTKTAKTYLFLVPESGPAIRVEAGIGKSPKALKALQADLESALLVDA